MKKVKERGFTLIELIVVLVILAVIALIVTPIILNIVDKAELSARKRSVDAYGKAAELAIATYRMEKGYYPKNLDELNIEYSGSNVKCNKNVINKNGSVYLSKCYVDSIKIMDEKTDDGWYHYGTEPNYLTYIIGDIITYKGVKFYVIKNSSSKDDSVLLLKADILTVEEVSKYISGDINIDNQNGFALIKYNDNTYDYNCSQDYENSYVKNIVDAWSDDAIGSDNITEDTKGYKARILTLAELYSNLGFENKYYCSAGCDYRGSLDSVPKFVYDANYWIIGLDGAPFSEVNSRFGLYAGSCNSTSAIRPVINLKKSVIE